MTVTAEHPSASGPAVVRGQLRRWAQRTDGRLTVMIAVLVALGALAGLVGTLDLAHRSAVLANIAEHDGPLTMRALDVYHSLADADATSANEFLAGVSASPELWQRFQGSIAQAASALNSAALLNGSSPNAAPAAALAGCPAPTDTVLSTPVTVQLDLLARELPVYTGLIETARGYNRMGMPLGSTYLELASTMMRQDMLLQAHALYAELSGQLAAAQAVAASFPGFSVAFAVVLIAALVVAQILLYRHTRRRLNVGLLCATGATLLAVAVLLVASLGAISGARASDTDGTGQIQVLAAARVDALQARADETVVLILQGNGASFETAFGDQSTCLRTQLGKARAAVSQADGRTAVDAAAGTFASWSNAHNAAREANAGGAYATAVRLTIGTGPGSTSSLAGQVDQDIGHAITLAGDRFDGAVAGARNDLSATPVWFAILIALAVASAVAGLLPRISEYR